MSQTEIDTEITPTRKELVNSALDDIGVLLDNFRVNHPTVFNAKEALYFLRGIFKGDL